MCGANTYEVHLSAGAGCGGWRLGREIGSGAYGVVHFATGPGGAVAAVKVCRRDSIGDERYGRELRGAKLYSAIPPQEGLVRMMELIEEPWGFCSVMELADDEFGRGLSDAQAYRPKTLAAVIEGEKALPLSESVDLGVTLARGLVVLQRHHLLHRDIKPGNVVYIGGRPALSDPGLVVEDSKAVSLVGTPGYVPPENFTAAAGDIYSLGRTLKAASFGRRVEDLDRGPAQEADTGSKFFPAWWRIINKATDEDPRRRYRSAKALLRDLEGLRRRMLLASLIGSRAAKVAAAVVALGAAAAIAFALVAARHATVDAARSSAEGKAALTATYERAIRGSLGSILSEERINEMAQKAAAGEEARLTPAEQGAFRKHIGLDDLMEGLNDLKDPKDPKGSADDIQILQ